MTPIATSTETRSWPVVMPIGSLNCHLTEKKSGPLVPPAPGLLNAFKTEIRWLPVITKIEFASLIPLEKKSGPILASLPSTFVRSKTEMY